MSSLLTFAQTINNACHHSLASSPRPEHCEIRATVRTHPFSYISNSMMHPFER